MPSTVISILHGLFVTAAVWLIPINISILIAEEVIAKFFIFLIFVSLYWKKKILASVINIKKYDLLKTTDLYK